MSRCDTTEQIKASPSRIWAEFRPDRLPVWYGYRVEPLSHSPLTRGSRLRVGGPHEEYEATVTEYAENRMLTWEGASAKANYRVALLLAPKDGYTLVLLRDEFHTRGFLGRLQERLVMQGRAASAARKALTALKRLAEG